jgi:hypothetical protein
MTKATVGELMELEASLEMAMQAVSAAGDRAATCKAYRGMERLYEIAGTIKAMRVEVSAEIARQEKGE